ncbi:OstA-like protein [Arcicella rosea]|uniref:Lipopolysaccharide export system protein LptA n=1 Tax=Arcicella rosea TaxID=502909 RepID=A0A841EMW2_9BACT|nr:OstA-like protein [Arcicella rosea]MBB6002078.1 lipopolysaccharide export system protein LptA [Arcicella rosea]
MKYSTKIHQINAIQESTKAFEIDKSISKVLSYIFLSSILLNITFFSAKAQTSTGNPSQVEIIKADSLIGQNQPFMQMKKLIGNVGLRQGTTLLYCNLAILNETTNILEAYGKVKIIQADTVTITGDTAYYFGNERKAIINGHVKLDDRTIILSTSKLDYDLNTSIAYYNTGGKIIDKKSTLTSKEGYYNTVTKLFDFKKDVHVLDKEGSLTADSLRYSTLSKEAFFVAPTLVVNKKDTTYANPGSQYNTVTKISNLKGRSTVKTEDYTMTADTMIYDPPTEIGIAIGNIHFISKKDKAILTGDRGRYSKKTGVTRVFGHALLKNVFENDTLFLTADTLVSLDNKETKTKKLYAYKRVLIYKSDFSGKCDSLSYNVSDSTIYFYQKPVLWNLKNQSEADSINILLKNNKISVMNMKGKSFVISTDTLTNYNQIKGRKMVVRFTNDSKIEKVNVEGNGESIYYAVDEKNTLTGMNRVQCAKMNMNFSKNKISRIAFLGKPEGRFIPPKELKEEDKELDGFRWRVTEMPTKSSILARVSPPIIVLTKAIVKDSIEVKKVDKKNINLPNNKIKKKSLPKL